MNLDYIECYSSLIENAAISPASLTFDKNAPADAAAAVEWNDAGSITGIKAGTDSIGAANYSVSGNILTIRKDYLASKPIGKLVLSVVFVRGDPVTLTIEITDTRPPACQIDATNHIDLGAALASVGKGEAKTVKLLADIAYDAGITVENRTVIFDLNGYVLYVDNGAGYGLTVGAGGMLGGVHARRGAVVRVKDMAVGMGTCVRAEGGSTVTIDGISVGYMSYVTLEGIELTIEDGVAGTGNYLIYSDGNGNTVRMKIVGATIDPAVGTFDRNPEHQADVSTSITWVSASGVTDVKLNAVSIGTEGYTVSDGTLTIRKEYLAAQPLRRQIILLPRRTGTSSSTGIPILLVREARPMRRARR